MPDKITLLIIPALLLNLLGFLLSEAEASGQKVIEQQIEEIQAKYRDLSSLSFDFNQLTRSGGRDREGAGNAVFYRPDGKAGVMRWNYTKPDTQIILNDSKKLTIYTKEDNQMIVTSANELESDITYAFFTGKRNLLDDFNALPPGDRFTFSEAGQAIVAVQLVPKEPHAQIKNVHLWFDEDHLIKRLVMEDHFDSITELSFTNIKLNPLPPDSRKTLADLLKLDLPAGTEVISQ